jgi:hypothetical protein
MQLQAGSQELDWFHLSSRQRGSSIEAGAIFFLFFSLPGRYFASTNPR